MPRLLSEGTLLILVAALVALAGLRRHLPGSRFTRLAGCFVCLLIIAHTNAGNLADGLDVLSWASAVVVLASAVGIMFRKTEWE
jgi:hypothetical protein